MKTNQKVVVYISREQGPCETLHGKITRLTSIGAYVQGFDFHEWFPFASRRITMAKA